MKKTLLILVTGMVAMSASARHLTADEALSRIGSQQNRIAALSGIQTRATASQLPVALPYQGIYIFNTNPGFIIVSADDCAEPLLGYSTEGNFDYATAPENVIGWLEAYNNEIEWGSLSGMEYVPQGLSLSAAPVVKPLIDALWDQNDPYNMMCSEKVGKTVATGCVATAMAQLMYPFKYPEKGQNSIRYNSTKSGYNATIDVDFSTLTFDWDNIVRSYTGTRTDAEKQAVSTLMWAVAAANQLQFGATTTGYTQNIPEAMYKYLNYTPAVQWVSRDFYTATEWEDMIYNQLTQGLAVKYGGYTPSNEGHAFVCDGSDGKGYFHINWGWGSDYNGYFKLTALDPAGQGTGGGTGGYNKDQDMVINVFPAGQEQKYPNIDKYLIYSVGNFNAQNLTTATQSLNVTLGNNVTFFSGGNTGGGGNRPGAGGSTTTGIRNQNGLALTGNAGILILPNDGGTPVESYSANTTTLNTSTTSATSGFSIPLPAGLAQGSYIVVPIFKVQGEDGYVEIKGKPSANNSMTLEVGETGATLSWGGVNPETTAIEFTSKVAVGTTFSMDFTLQNSTPVNYSGTIGVKFYNGETLVAQSATDQAVDVSVAAGESGAGSFTGTVSNVSGQTLTPGDYSVVLYDLNTNKNISNAENATFTVTVEEAPPATVFTISNLAVSRPVGSNPYSVVVTGTVKCTQGYFADYVTVTVTQKYATTNVVSATSDYLYLDAGESGEFSVPFQLTNAYGGSSSYQYQYTIKAESGSRSATLSYTLDPTIYTLDITDSSYTVDEENAEASVTLNYEVSQSFVNKNLQVTVNGEAYEGGTFTIAATTGSVDLTLPLEDGENNFTIELSVGTESASETLSINYTAPVVSTLDILKTDYTVEENVATVTIDYEVSENLIDETLNVTVNGQPVKQSVISAATDSVTFTLNLENGLNSFEIVLSVGDDLSAKTIVEINYVHSGLAALGIQGNDRVEVYDLNGRLVFRGAAGKVAQRVKKGIYLIKNGDSIIKISL